ncbi:hypothetical protein ZIOFF_043010 [Zingiber officinale]|uniref:Dirigent protein n=1 Tax=Zingiber officinale TaxID=94328 RepID=A0A8J5FYE9_ZINOF|nr:hypothetical protein ZIOFF_043010 [Zingiber officinale]
MVYAVELRREAPYGNGFGNIIVFDNVLRETAEPASPAIGMEQGFGVGSSLAQNSGLTMLELVFTAGRYGRSSLSVFEVAPCVGRRGRSRLALAAREMSCLSLATVGGHGRPREPVAGRARPREPAASRGQPWELAASCGWPREPTAGRDRLRELTAGHVGRRSQWLALPAALV